MAKSINEISALNSVKKVQVASEVKKTKRGTASKRSKSSTADASSARTAKSASDAGSAQRVRKASPSATKRAALKKAQRTAARNLFTGDSLVVTPRVNARAGSSVRASNLAATSPLTTLAPGATLHAGPGGTIALNTEFDPQVVPAAIRSSLPASTLPTSGNLSIGALYRALAPGIGGAKAFEFCETMLQERWDSWMEAEKAWQEDEAENAKANEEASIRAQQRAVEEKRVRTSTQLEMKHALDAAHNSHQIKNAAAQARLTRRKLRTRSVPAPVRVAQAVAPASGIGSHTVTTSVVDTLDSTPVPGFALTAPAEPIARPAPASPQERGARQAKRLRQSADEIA